MNRRPIVLCLALLLVQPLFLQAQDETPIIPKARISYKDIRVLAVIAAVTSVADVEITQVAQRRNPEWREYNPVYGVVRPGRVRMYAVEIGANVGAYYLARYLKRRGHNRLAKIPQLIEIGGNTWGIQQNLRNIASVKSGGGSDEATEAGRGCGVSDYIPMDAVGELGISGMEANRNQNSPRV